VIRYYNNVQNPGRWAQLSPFAQAAFGGEAQFNQYWSGFRTVSSEDANGVTPNGDGTVTVPFTVTYTAQDGTPNTQRKSVRVTVLNGNLLIDSEAR
jgi:hypothetical protein